MQTPQYKKYLEAYKERRDEQDRIAAFRKISEARDSINRQLVGGLMANRIKAKTSLWRRFLNGWSFYYTNVLFGAPASMNVPRSDDVPRGT